ncbi:dicarboxylate transporter [Penicillium brasilianum]|uniref:Dicarboxylate transporter n=1 Tax=Penicillium brasilianum TaxID=104259 RepID=A0A1S9RY98_PENBI|nr:dicarboxylate transporter [Penicillium brasilianum]
MASTKIAPLPAPQISPASTKHADITYPRWFGGSASCMAVMVSHPFDLIKVRMQTVAEGAKQNSVRTGIQIIHNEGVRGLYHGLSAGLMRSLTYGASRIALYEELKQSANKSEKPITTPMLTMMAAASGFVGAIFGTPSDIVNIRMQNDRSLPIQDRRKYKHVLDAWVQMKRHEGWRAFAQGLWPNCFRCGIMTASQLASYDKFKDILQRWSSFGEESPVIHISASLLASLVATSISSPMDVIRTQLMSSPTRVSVLRIVANLTRSEGYRWVFRGWTPSFVRLGPQTIATLVALEQHKRIYRLLKTGGDQS